MCARYGERAAKAGRQLGVGTVTVREIADAEGPTRARREGARVLAQRPAGVFVVLDERGEGWSSTTYAARLQGWLQAGVPGVTFALGGADGHDPAVRAAADATVSLGAITLPHLLARAVLMEQIYRAVTICLGHPYHRA